MWLALLGVKVLHARQWDSTVELFVNSWPPICGDSGFFFSSSPARVALSQTQAICNCVATTMECWWKPNVSWPKSPIKRAQKVHRRFRDTEPLREGTEGHHHPPFPSPNVVYLFADCTTSGKFVSPPEQCHSIFHVAPHQSAEREEMAGPPPGHKAQQHAATY